MYSFITWRLYTLSCAPHPKSSPFESPHIWPPLPFSSSPSPYAPLVTTTLLSGILSMRPQLHSLRHEVDKYSYKERIQIFRTIKTNTWNIFYLLIYCPNWETFSLIQIQSQGLSPALGMSASTLSPEGLYPLPFTALLRPPSFFLSLPWFWNYLAFKSCCVPTSNLSSILLLLYDCSQFEMSCMATNLNF